jgi:hypothetical protein
MISESVTHLDNCGAAKFHFAMIVLKFILLCEIFPKGDPASNIHSLASSSLGVKEKILK